MNKTNLAYLLLGVLIGVFGIKSAQESWSIEKETLKLVTSVDLPASATGTGGVNGGVVEGVNGGVTEGVNGGVTEGVNGGVTGGKISTAQDTAKSADLSSSNNDVAKQAAQTINSSNIGGTANGTDIQDFVRHEKVVIAMKIHGEPFLPEVKQALCLLHAAYNSRVLYDIVIFHTTPLPEADMAVVQAIVHPAKVTFVMDEKTLEQQIEDMTPEQREKLVARCNDANTTADLSWHHRCVDGKTVMPIAYCWMSEFRSKQIWRQKVLEPYKYMLWWDSDNFATMVWQQDPIDYMVREDLVLLMGNYGQGTTRGSTGVQQKLYQVYNKTLCGSKLLKNGRLHATYGTEEECNGNGVKQVHGFFHITNLDFYRLPVNLHWYDVQIGDHKFSRLWDDQLAVMTPPVMLAPERSAEMEAVGIRLEVMHNGMIMGKRKWKGGAYKAFWRGEAQTKFPEARKMCSPYIKVPSRL